MDVVLYGQLYNEAMDYCEWKNGYRVEATIGVARNLITKIQNVAMTSIKSLILDGIGYTQGITVGTQSDKTKWWLFALCTGIPQITGILAVIPKFLYPLSGNLRNQMYSELMQRRHEMNEKMTKESNEIKNNQKESNDNQKNQSFIKQETRNINILTPLDNKLSISPYRGNELCSCDCKRTASVQAL